MAFAAATYVSVSSQRDTERALIEKERHELATMLEAELAELTGLLSEQGLSAESASATARQLTKRDALKTHLRIELGIDWEELANPWIAAGSSALAFAVGAVAPLIAILVQPASIRVAATFVGVLIALLATGWLSAHLGGAAKRAAIVRLVVGRAIAMAVTFGIGYVFGVATGDGEATLSAWQAISMPSCVAQGPMDSATWPQSIGAGAHLPVTTTSHQPGRSGIRRSRAAGAPLNDITLTRNCPPAQTSRPDPPALSPLLITMKRVSAFVETGEEYFPSHQQSGTDSSASALAGVGSSDCRLASGSLTNLTA